MQKAAIFVNDTSKQEGERAAESKTSREEKKPTEIFYEKSLICQLLFYELIIIEKSSCFTAGSCYVLLIWWIDFIENDKCAA